MTVEPTAPALEGPKDPTTGVHKCVAILLLVAAWLAFCYPAFTGKVRFPMDFGRPPNAGPAEFRSNPEMGDPYFVSYPWHSYLGKRIRSGEIPLWDPHRFGGVPFAANLGIGVFYPPNWLYATGEVLFAFTVIAIVSFGVALGLAYWFLRVLRLHPYAAALGSLVFVFSAFLMKWSEHEPVFGSAMWLPLVLGGLEVARRGRIRRGILLSSLGLALSILAGHAQIALYCWLVACLWTLVNCVAAAWRSHREGEGDQVRTLLLAAGPAAAAAIFALALAAVQILPAIQFSREVTRQKETYSEVLETALQTYNLPQFLIPDFRGNPMDHNFAGPGVYTETVAYAGLATLPLAFMGLGQARRRRGACFAIIFAVGCVAAFGTPLYRLLFALPGFSRTLYISRFTLLIDFGLAGLAALGLDGLVRRPRPKIIIAATCCSVAIIAAILFLTFASHSSPMRHSYIAARGTRSLVLMIFAGVLVAGLVKTGVTRDLIPPALIVLVGIDLWLFGFRLHPYLPPGTVFPRYDEVRFLSGVAGARPRFADLDAQQIPPNSSLVYGLYDIGGYDIFVPGRYVELLSVAQEQNDRTRRNWVGPFRAGAFYSPVMDLLGVRTVVGPRDSTALPGSWSRSNFVVFDRPSALPPAFLASCWQVKSGPSVVAKIKTMTSADLASTAILEAGSVDPALQTLKPGPGCRPGLPAKINRYEPERVLLTADSPAGGVLVLTDNWAEGWKATVDGSPAKVMRVDHSLRGVALGAGTHTIEFVYRPKWLWQAGPASLSAVIFLVFCACWPRLKKSVGSGSGVHEATDAGL